MAVTVQLPRDMEERLRGEMPDLEARAKEAMLVELYRQDRITHYELGQAMGWDRFETDAALQRHGVTEDLPTPEELAEDLAFARRLVQP